MILILCGSVPAGFNMTNNFYNININPYNPSRTPQSENTSQPVNDEISQPAQNQTLPEFLNQPTQQEAYSHARLNALDSTILENEAYQNIDDETFKQEYRMSLLEQKIKSTEDEIQRAKEINDSTKVDVLTMRKHTYQKQLKSLNENYSDSDVATKLSGEITSLMTKKPKFLVNAINSCVSFMSNKILPKVSKKFNSGKTIKTALNKLETLNKNVDELVTMQTPYGEADERYDMLSDYLNRANVIHYNISKTVGTPTFFDTISSIDKEKFIAETGKNKSNFGNMTNRPKAI